MRLYGDAVAAIKSIVLVDNRVQSLAGKVGRLADEVRRISDRLTRLETIVEVARPEGVILRIVCSGPDDRTRVAGRPSGGAACVAAWAGIAPTAAAS